MLIDRSKLPSPPSFFLLNSGVGIRDSQSGRLPLDCLSKLLWGLANVSK